MAECPNCKKQSAHRAHRSGLLDRIAHKCGFSPYHCDACDLRFRRFRFRAPAEIPEAHRGTTNEIKRTRRELQYARIKQEILVYSVAGFLFLLFLLLIVRERG